MRESAPVEIENWKLESERTEFFTGYPSGPVRRDRSTLMDDQLRPWLQDHRGIVGYPRRTENGHITVARLLSLHRDDSDSEGPDISVTYAWLGPGDQVLRGSVTEGYDRYSPGGLGVLLQDQSALLVHYDETTLRSTLHPAFTSPAPAGLPTSLVAGWPQVKPEVLSRVLQLKRLPVSLVVLQQEGLEPQGAPPGAIGFPLPSASPCRGLR